MSASKQVYYDYQVQQFNGYADCEWQEIYQAEQLAADYRRWQMEEAEAKATEAQQEATAAPVVIMFTDTLPAQPAALNPFMEDMAKNQVAIAATIIELNMLILNTADAAFRSQVKTIANGLINKSGLMDSTKENYLQMLAAAEANAACYYGQQVVDTKPAICPYKRKYDSASDIARHLATTSSTKEVASLYYVNAELIEQTPALKQSFMDRKARLYRPSVAAA